MPRFGYGHAGVVSAANLFYAMVQTVPFDINANCHSTTVRVVLVAEWMKEQTFITSRRREKHDSRRDAD